MREHLREVVERALQRELAVRRNLRPHAQLGIAPDATASDVAKAYARLRGRYETVSLSDYGPAAADAAGAIAELLRHAQAAMHEARANGRSAETLPALVPDPRGDETCRALQTLRAAIERRALEGEAHRRAGRIREATRVFESVLLLDRNHQLARQALRELRALARSRRGPLSRMLSRVFKRPAAIDGDGAGRDLT